MTGKAIKQAKLITIAIDELIFDELIYPRKTVNGAHVHALADALAIGTVLPPIVIDQKKRIIDGKHRCEAHRRFYGEGATIEAQQNRYASEADALLAATEYNERHGLRLESFERTDVVIRLKNLKASPARIALALHVPEQRVERILLVRTAVSSTPERIQVPLKRSMSEFAGRELTKQEQEANDSAPGTAWVTHIQQLNKALRAGLGVTWGLDVRDHLAITFELLSAAKTKHVA